MKSSKKRRVNNSLSFPGFLAILGIFFVMMSGSLLAVYVNSQKKYDPALENKLNQKTIPTDVKKVIANASPSASFRVPVLMYHYVEVVQDRRDTIRMSLDTLPSTFENQIIALKGAGYTFMTASQLGKALDGESKMPKKPILLTFDDGHRDFFTDAYPILKKYNVPATAYIIQDFLGGSDFMDTYQVQQIANEGLVEIGDHTFHHVYLKGQTLKIDQKEIENSKVAMQREFNIPIVSFAYPYGAFDARAIDVVKNAGYTTAMSTLPGIIITQPNRYFIERIRPGARVGDNLVNFLDNYQQPASTATTPQD